MLHYAGMINRPNFRTLNIFFADNSTQEDVEAQPESPPEEKKETWNANEELDSNPVSEHDRWA